MSNRWRVPARLAVTAIVAAFAVAALAGTAAGQSQGGSVKATGSRGHVGLGLSPSLMKSARWIRLKDGKQVYGVPLSIRVSHGKVLAHPAAYGNCVYCAPRRNAGSGMCMSSYPNTQGSYVFQYTCTNAANQEWIYAIGADYEPYIFAYNANNLCLNNFQDQFSNGSLMALWSCNSASAPMWFGVGVSNYSGYYLIHLFKSFGTWSNQCVTVLPNRPSDSPVEQWLCDKSSQWQAFSGPTDAVDPPEGGGPPEWTGE